MTTYYIQTNKDTVHVYKFAQTHSKLLASYPKIPFGHAQARSLINQLEGKSNETTL